MPYPSRPVLEPLEEFKGSATVRQSPEQRARLLAFAAEQYVAGRSLRQIAELTDRTQTVLCISQPSETVDGRSTMRLSLRPSTGVSRRASNGAVGVRVG